jgi:hypothetical protein
MSIRQYWGEGDEAWIMPTLWELTENGTVHNAGTWPELKADVERGLGDRGAGDSAAYLVKPLDDAVGRGEDYRTLIDQLNAEHHQLVAAQLPPAEELADLLVYTVGSQVGALFQQHPELGLVGDDELIAWVTEDIQSTLDGVAASGWGLSQ